MTETTRNNVDEPRAESAEWTVQKVLAWSIDFVRDRGIERSRLEVEKLLAASLGVERIELYTKFDRALTGLERAKFKEYLIRKSKGEPVAYILGHRDFFGHRFAVSPATLIPRPDTEVLVERAIEHIQSLKGQVQRVVDLGTGTGCIAISMAKVFPEIEFYAVDICSDALGVAKANIEAHGIENMHLVQADIRDSDFWNKIPKVDMIVSNPPYIGELEKADLPKEVVDFEPHKALFAENAGLYFYELIQNESSRILNENGSLFVEVGYQQGAIVAEMLEKSLWQGVKVFADYSGTPRVVSGVCPK
jgi:release factor glutamine methyltransferase